jgi:hypothetical protein
MQMLSIAFLLSAAFVVLVRLRNRSRKRIVLTDFRRGVHFVNGSFKAVLGPGAYRYDSRKEQITVVDMRPQPILIDRLGFQDALRHDGVISVGTELLVRDPRLAATALRDNVKDSYVVVRDTIRMAMSALVAPGAESAASVAAAIATAVNAELAKVGMGVSEIEITELFTVLAKSQTIVASGTIQ